MILFQCQKVIKCSLYHGFMEKTGNILEFEFIYLNIFILMSTGCFIFNIY